MVIADLTVDPAVSVERKFELQVKMRRRKTLRTRVRLELKKLETKRSPRSRKRSLRLPSQERMRSRRASCARFPGV